jgi:hypothetical protein
MITKTAFTIRLNYSLLVAAIIALVSAVLSFSSFPHQGLRPPSARSHHDRSVP